MSYDPYQPCPACVGTDKKIKFCCQPIVGEMEKVSRLREGGQHQQATTTLRRLHEKHPDNAWIATALAGAVLHAYGDEARQLLRRVLETTPDHPFALALLAVHSLSRSGYERAKPIVHRALQKSAPHYPEMMSQVVLGIAEEAYATGRFLMAREHLALALRLVPGDEERRDVFMRLLEFEGDREIPYPLRSVHQLARETSDDDERKMRHNLALRLCSVGLWAEAAGVIAKLCEEEPENAVLWQNRGFCHAWDGDHASAAESLHRAAGLADDFETAVELETIAQLLDHEVTEDRVGHVPEPYRVESVSRLLSSLDFCDRLVRTEPPRDREETSEVGAYRILDRPRATEPLGDDATLDDVAEVIGQILVFDGEGSEDGVPRAFVSADEGERLEVSCSLFEEVAGEAATREEGARESLESIPRELQHFQWRWQFPEGTPEHVRRALERQRWAKLVDEVWPNTKLAGLGGRTPNEARDDESARVPLAAAIATFDAYCDRSGYELDVPELRRRFGLPAPATFELAEDRPLNSLSSMQLHRLDVASLSDEQLVQIADRATLVHHSTFLGRLLAEVVERPSCRDVIDVEKCLLTLTELARQRFDVEQALRWTERGLEETDRSENPFESAMRWRMLQMHLRLERPHDPELPKLLDTLWNEFGRKLPQLRQYLEAVVARSGLDVDWAGREGIVTPESAAAPSEGVWTPGAPETPAGASGPGKLWVPGQ